MAFQAELGALADELVTTIINTSPKVSLSPSLLKDY